MPCTHYEDTDRGMLEASRKELKEARGVANEVTSLLCEALSLVKEKIGDGFELPEHYPKNLKAWFKKHTLEDQIREAREKAEEERRKLKAKTEEENRRRLNKARNEIIDKLTAEEIQVLHDNPDLFE